MELIIMYAFSVWEFRSVSKSIFFDCSTLNYFIFVILFPHAIFIAIYFFYGSILIVEQVTPEAFMYH